MKSKAFLVSALALLLLSFAAGAAEVDRETSSAILELETLMKAISSANMSENCGARILADLNPEPRLNAAWSTTCGQCSQNPCKGRVEGSLCASGGQWKWCIAATGSVCSGTQDWNCRCASDYF